MLSVSVRARWYVTMHGIKRTGMNERYKDPPHSIAASHERSSSHASRPRRTRRIVLVSVPYMHAYESWALLCGPPCIVQCIVLVWPSLPCANGTVTVSMPHDIPAPIHSSKAKHTKLYYHARSFQNASTMQLIHTSMLCVSGKLSEISCRSEEQG